jgi:hypothetical protein
LLVVEDDFAEKHDLLKVVEGGRLRLAERFALDAVDLQFDRPDFLLGRGRNPIPIGWTDSLAGKK